jgi:CheY-like chemotaxis protein
MTLLLVDDEKEYRLLLKNLLTDEGWDVLTAEDGAQALQLLQRVRVDVIITDIYMPAIDGFRLHQAVRGLPGYERVPIIFVSAFDDDYTMSVVKDPKCETFLAKTSPIESFFDWIRFFSLPESKRPALSPNAETSFGLPKPQYLFTP